MKAKQLLNFSVDAHKISIEIPISLLVHVAKYNPELCEEKPRIKDKYLLAKEVAFELEENLGENETGLTGFQELIDRAVVEVYESGSEAFKHDD